MRGHNTRGSDEARFDSMFRATYPRVLAYCLRRASVEIAHAATAEVFTIAWRRRRDVPTGDAVPWLLGVARRVLANEYRGQRRRPRLASLVAAPGITISEAADLPIKRALDALSEPDRELGRTASSGGPTGARSAPSRNARRSSVSTSRIA